MMPTLALFNDVGGGELIVVGIIALLLFGRNLPSVSRSVGKALGQFKKGISDATSEIQNEMTAAAAEVERTKSEVKAGITPVLTLQDSGNSSAPHMPPAPLARGDTAPPDEPQKIENEGPRPMPRPAAAETTQALDRSEAPAGGPRPLVRPAPGTVAASSTPGALTAAAALDRMDVPPPAKIPPPVE